MLGICLEWHVPVDGYSIYPELLAQGICGEYHSAVCTFNIIINVSAMTHDSRRVRYHLYLKRMLHESTDPLLIYIPQAPV